MEINIEKMCRAKGISGTFLVEMEKKEIRLIDIGNALNKTKQAAHKQLHKPNDKYSEKEIETLGKIIGVSQEKIEILKKILEESLYAK